MVEYVLMGVMAALVILLMWLRANTAVCFLALCAGSVLLASSGDNLSLIASSVTSGIQGSTNVAKIVLLTLPMLVCAVITRKQVPRALFVLAFIPAIATAFLVVIFAVPLLSDSLQSQISVTETWKLLDQYKEFIVGAGLVVSLVLVSMTIKQTHDKHHKKKHH